MSKPWKSPEWRAFVRSLPCRCRDPRCPNCNLAHGGPADRVEAAHLRSHTGVGQKPPDFLCYPLSSTIHRVFHTKGHPSVEWQLDRVREVLEVAMVRGVLRFNPEATGWIDF